MKLSKTGWLIIIIGVFVIILAGLGTVRSQQVREQDQLNEEYTFSASQEHCCHQYLV